MNDPETYSWQTPYVFAILKLNPVRIPSKIDEALRASKERLRNPLEVGSLEHDAIQDARAGIAMFKASIANKPV